VVALAPDLLEGLAERARSIDLGLLDARLRASGGCARPIRLKGTVEVCEGDGRKRVWSTDSEPDGVLRKACGNRREAVCAPCAERYRGDAYQLIAAGLKGGKGVPDSITQHPAVFVTLTAPSFGVVHARPLGADGEPRRCRPRRDHPVCPHGRPLSCTTIHAEGDPRLGEPLCPDCFDYRGAVLWNHTLGTLWRYTTIYVPRYMADEVGMTQTALRDEVRFAYAKVAEYQRRGLVHLHVLARLDRAMPDYRKDELHPPAKRFDVELLERAIRNAVAEVSAPVAPELGDERVRWGGQVDVRRLQTGEQRGEVAGYLAKYATKSTEQAGGCCTRSRPTRSTWWTFASTCAATCAPRSTSTSRRRRPAPVRTPRNLRSTSRPTGIRPRSHSVRVARCARTSSCAFGSTTGPCTRGGSSSCSTTPRNARTRRCCCSSTPECACILPTSPRSARPRGRLVDASGAIRGWRRAPTRSATAATV
jgi:hypothetical protein